MAVVDSVMAEKAEQTVVMEPQPILEVTEVPAREKQLGNLEKVRGLCMPEAVVEDVIIAVVTVLEVLAEAVLADTPTTTPRRLQLILEAVAAVEKTGGPVLMVEAALWLFAAMKKMSSPSNSTVPAYPRSSSTGRR